MKIFLDTNIVIDYLSNREPFGEKAKQIFYLSESPDVELCVGNVSIDNFQNSAFSANVDCIVTRNTKDYTMSEISVYTPDTFLAKQYSFSEFDCDITCCI